MAGPKYEYEYKRFNEKYHVDFNIADNYDFVRRMTGFDAFTFNSDSTKTDEKIFEDVIVNTLEVYLAGKTKMAQDKNYSMSDFSLVEFMQGFDGLVQAIRSDEATENHQSYEHVPFAGADLDVISGRIYNRIKQYNQPLPDIWGQDIRKGTVSYEDIQRITDNSERMLNNLTGETYTHLSNKDLANVVMAKQAMDKAIEGRKWRSYLNPRNWFLFPKENSYRNALNRKIAEYREKGLPVDSAVPAEYGQKMLGSQVKELTKFIKDQKNPATAQVTEEKKPELTNVVENVENIENIKTVETNQKERVFSNADELDQKKPEPKKDVAKPVKDEKVNNLEKINELFEDEDYFSNLQDELYNEAKDLECSARLPDFVRAKFFKQNIETLQGTLETFCKEMDKAKSPEEEKETLDYNIGLIAYTLLSGMSTLNVVDEKEKAVAALKMTDIVLNKCTPIAFSGNKYAKYSNNYILKDDALLNRFVSDLKSDDREMMNELRKEFGVDKKIEGYTDQEKHEIETEKRNREYDKQQEEKKRLEEEAKAKEKVDVKDDLDGMDDRKSDPVIEKEKEKARSIDAISN